MKTLETQLSYAGHILRQIWRSSDVAIYERARPGKEPHELELILIKITKEAQLPSGSILPEHEAYPRPSQWGQLAWSFPIRHKAWVLDLGQKVIGISKARAGFVHEQMHQLWAKERAL